MIKLLITILISINVHANDLYDNKCAKCHGATGAGDGRAGRSLKTPPTAFSDRALMSKISDQELADAIKYGGGTEFEKRNPGKSISREMEGYDLSPEEIKSLVAYTRSLTK